MKTMKLVSRTSNYVQQPKDRQHKLKSILFITSFPPRECGIATFSKDLTDALQRKFNESFLVKICRIENDESIESYDSRDAGELMLNTDRQESYAKIGAMIRENMDISLVVLQHEFSFFERNPDNLLHMLQEIAKPVVVVFHTVLPNPNRELERNVRQLCSIATAVVCMTDNSKRILCKTYAISSNKVTVIPHGTHLVSNAEKKTLKQKYDIHEKVVLSTFGFLNKGKSIETTLRALPTVIQKAPNVLFLIIGKTHPNVLKEEGEEYRQLLERTIEELHLQPYVRFVNQFVPIELLLEYLQLTDIYVFSSKDPNQAVSGTLSYANSIGCPIVSTPIPHAKELLDNERNIIVDFEQSEEFAEGILELLRKQYVNQTTNPNEKTAHTIATAATAWENAAISYAELFQKIIQPTLSLHYSLPAINLSHIQQLTTDVGIVQFSHYNQPDINSGYTLDDNARALVAMCQHYVKYHNAENLRYIFIYIKFIDMCLKNDTSFLNYVDKHGEFSPQNDVENLDDSNGRAIWALGYVISCSEALPSSFVIFAQTILDFALLRIDRIHSTRAMAFIIKGMFLATRTIKQDNWFSTMNIMSSRLERMYYHHETNVWKWFEPYFTYANSVMPEAMLLSWIATGNNTHKIIAKTSFDFLLLRTFRDNQIHVISNKTWIPQNIQQRTSVIGGEQPIDVAYTVLALEIFDKVFPFSGYLHKCTIAFDWFLGRNHLHQIVYNPCTGGCYDGVEQFEINLNQGAESTVSYTMARLVMESLLSATTTKKSIVDYVSFNSPSVQPKETLKVTNAHVTSKTI